MLRIFAMFMLMLVCMHAATPSAAQTSVPQGGAPAAPPRQYAYIELLPMTLTDSSEQAVILITLEVPVDKKAVVEGMLGRLSDAFMAELQVRSGGGANMMQGKMVNVDAIKARLMKTAEKLAGPGLVHDMALDVLQGRT